MVAIVSSHCFFCRVAKLTYAIMMDTVNHDTQLDQRTEGHHDARQVDQTILLLVRGDVSNVDHVQQPVMMPDAFGLRVDLLIKTMVTIPILRKTAIQVLKNESDIMTLALTDMNAYLNDEQLWSDYPVMMLLRRLCFAHHQQLFILSKTLPFKMMVPCRREAVTANLIALDWIEMFFHINPEHLKLMMFLKFINLADHDGTRRRRYRRSFGWIVHCTRSEWVGTSSWQLSTPELCVEKDSLLMHAINHHIQWLLAQKFQLKCHWLSIHPKTMDLTMRMTEDGIAHFMDTHRATKPS